MSEVLNMDGGSETGLEEEYKQIDLIKTEVCDTDSSQMIVCPLCSETSPDIHQHVRDIHSSIYCIKCRICSRMEHRGCFKCGQSIEDDDLANMVVKDEPMDILEVEHDFDLQDGKVGVTSGRSLKSPIQCNLCSEWFNSKDADLVHQVFVHGLLYCVLCDSLLNNESEKVGHDRNAHQVFKCAQCSQAFQSQADYNKHREQDHEMFCCKFCDYIFPEHQRISHMFRSHKLKINQDEEKIDTFLHPDFQLITFDKNSNKSKCKLCDKDIVNGKLFNHIRYYHNCSTGPTIQNLTAVGFKLTNNPLKNPPKQIQSKHPSKDEITLIFPLNKKSENPPKYECWVCKEEQDDYGGHMSLEHGLMRCRVEGDCHAFLGGVVERRRHELEMHADKSYPCSVCGVGFENLFDLMSHRLEEHKMQTCPLCDSIILTSVEHFGNHVMQFHHIKNKALINDAKRNPILTKLLNASLVVFNKEEMIVECKLCISEILDVGRGAAKLWQHLERIHKVKLPHEVFLPLFNGSEFCYKNHCNMQDDEKLSVKSKFDCFLEEGIKEDVEITVGEEGSVMVKKIDQTEKPNKVKKKVKRKNPRKKEINSPCIVCGKAFDDSISLQNHLLRDHINYGAGGSRNRKASESCEEAIVIPDDSDKEDDDIVDDDDDIEIDEEHYSINHVEVNLGIGDDDHLDESDFCHVVDDNVCIIDSEDDVGEEEEIDDDEESEYNAIQELNDNEHDMNDDASNLNTSPSKLTDEDLDGEVSGEIVGDVGKAPVFLKCDVCGVILTSILAFTTHMKKRHKDSDQEKNKPFVCDICQQGFYFQSSLNSHKSKAHLETSGDTFRCPFCPSVTNSKNGMRRHLRNSHKTTEYINDELSYKCKFCEEMFWSVSERTKHVADKHKEANGDLEKCFVCFHISPNRHALRRHFQRMHPQEPLFENVSFKCGDCGLLFPQRPMLTAHIKETHPKAVAFQCAYCPQQFRSKKSMAGHVNKHKRENLPESTVTFTCNICGKEFGKKRSLMAHFSTTHTEKGKKGFVCRICKERLESGAERSVHYKLVHPDMKPFQCSVCGSGFTTKSSLYNHRMTHVSGKQFSCQYCGKEFSRRDCFNEHLLIHVGPRHRCPHCPKEFVQKSNLKRHVRIHLGIKPYKCEFCEMTFSDKGACNSHQRTHTGEEREACPVCNVVFSKKQKLRYHMRLHTGEGLENCHICGKTFTHQYALNSHLKMHSRSSGHMCQVCKKYISSPAQLLKHVNKHSDLKLNCDQCGKKFSLSKLLNRHIMAVHEKVKGFCCSTPQCEAAFFELTKIRQHIQEVHSNKNPIYGIHFLDQYNENPTLDPEAFNQDEDDLPLLYDVLDQDIDNCVLGQKKGKGKQKKEKVKVKVKKTKGLKAKDESGFESDSDGGMFDDIEDLNQQNEEQLVKTEPTEEEVA